MPDLNIEMSNRSVVITVEYEHSLDGIPEYVTMNEIINVLSQIMVVNT